MSDTHKSKTQNEELKTKNSEKSEVALREEEVLKFWNENDIFNKSVDKKAPNGDFVFYDGPPFATGLPHVGSLLSSIIKDVVGRYWTMKGYRVERRWGWDCHGLPIENMIEKELGLKTKKDIFELGIGKFNEACRASVLRYADEWKRYITRIGRWTEYDGAYKTMDNSFMESVWWFLSEMHKKGHLYEGRKVLLYCPHCETPLSKAEIAMDNSYKDVTEESVYVKFKVLNPEKHNLPQNTYLLAWTTTPWTLPGNVALAVAKDKVYGIYKIEGEYFIVVKERAESLKLGIPENELSGAVLLGAKYEPLYEVSKVNQQDKKNAFTVLPADFVTTEEGTGIVHTAVIYGEDDYQLGLKCDLPMVPLLDQSGHFNQDAPELIRGKYFKQSEKFIKEDLEKRELLFAKENHTHSYPHCYRCGTALLYNALVSWFLDVQKIKKKMLKTNEDINWFPEHLKHGRYKNILENAPDWAISRNRFWATALPIWRYPNSDKLLVVSSVEELKKHTKHSGNHYFLMRHGEAESNLNGAINADPSRKNPLTEKGREQTLATAKDFKKQGIDLIIHSELERTRDTARLVAEQLGLSPEAVVEDSRLNELNPGAALEGKKWSDYEALFGSLENEWNKTIDGVENRRDVIRRIGQLLYELEQKYKDKKILLVGHISTLNALRYVVSTGANMDLALAAWREQGNLSTATWIELPFTPLPHNADYELDLHRPYIDELPVVAEDGTFLERIPEVIDCWVESGSMPFAALNYPHSNKEKFKKAFPADFIAEYIAQTRTWFYYMHTVSVLLFGKPSFKNVVTTGNVLAGDGAKMSKSKKNYTDPIVNLDLYGADAMRYYLMSSVVMQAEDMSFKDAEIKEAQNRVLNILWNTYKFYDLYKKEFNTKTNPLKSNNVLDIWILSRLNELTDEVTKYMDSYDLTRATRPIRTFVEDFSTWYVRRSRERLKAESSEDKQYALAVFRHTLEVLSRLIAPVMPFIAEDIYRGIGGEMESVHLAEWPKVGKVHSNVLENMRTVKEVVSRALEARASANIKVRQPLQKLSVKQDSAALYEPYASLITDEVNVKELVFDETLTSDVMLNTEITSELKKEGDAREFIRSIQEQRKKLGLNPSDKIRLDVLTGQFIEGYEDEIKRVAGVQEIVIGPLRENYNSIKIGDAEYRYCIIKI